ncbi:GNAT family N-acetyltransferase [Chitinophaga deserti]|uniref:GNAT family N-acetyltransferase n=1 Tax=Chitinophaga deserti TaxID=2164099 RepID=UPI000D6D3299|nr:GNAT family N-acetyltransferase [Chitinophaga deserti]
MQQGPIATVVTTVEELRQIAALSESNHSQQLSPEEKSKEGFVTWSYNLDILLQLHAIAPAVIVKDGDTVAGYALVLTKAGAGAYLPLQSMLDNFNHVVYKGRPLNSHNYYVMGQVCVHPAYRGKGVFAQLYEHHKTLYAGEYDFLLTEISTFNQRSLRAHEKVGFRPIHTYTDDMSTWSVVVWEWHEETV